MIHGTIDDGPCSHAAVLQGKVALEFACSVSCKLCADVIEWCPAVSFPELLAYGTYEHEESTGQRHGCLHVARVSASPSDDSMPGSDRSIAFVPEAELSMPGVYDVAWAPCSGEALAGGLSSSENLIMAVAGADGALRLVRLRARMSGSTPELELATAPCVLLEDGILTHVAWGANGSNGLAAVGQDGAAHHVVIREDGSLAELTRRAAHELEAWCVEVSHMDASPAGAHLVLTGADDSCLMGWDLREPPDAAPALVNRRTHGAGVTAVACNPHQEWNLATGSYDEQVRIFDLRSAARTPLLESERLGDGAYHLAWHPHWQGTLAVAAMRSGLPLLQANVNSSATEMPELARYAADAPEGSHGSLAYGISWQTVPAPDGRWFAASASFYDRSVHVWSVQAGAGSAAVAPTGADDETGA